VREMGRKVQRPMIFPLSNPTAKSEANADEVMRWTDGRALVATGSPVAPVSYAGRRMPIAQCNNIDIFPAIGLGVVASGAWRVTDTMTLAAARALAESSPARQDASASLLPALVDLRQVAVHIATAVGLEAQRAGMAPNATKEELCRRVMATQWTPAYPSLATSTMEDRWGWRTRGYGVEYAEHHGCACCEPPMASHHRGRWVWRPPGRTSPEISARRGDAF
jgi:malate dehydrogenase (oxaloacetate-decarboxylating)